MAQNITLQGASYSDVPSVLLPKTGGGTASFTDVTDTTASANDVTAGKYFYTAAGIKTEGTSTGGGGTTAGTVTQDANGYLILDDDAPTSITVESLSVTQNGTYTAPTGKAYSPVTVSVSGGSSGDMSDPIRFFDYDGTLVASYTAVPASLPSVPTHTGLTNGTWNYNLQQVTTQFNAMGTCDVGANYTTTSGATEIDVEFLDSARLSPYIGFSPNGTVTIDWGDETTDTLTGNSLSITKTVQHTYASTGKYTIKLIPASGTSYALYTASSGYALLMVSTTNLSNNSAHRVYSGCIKHVRVGSGCTLGANALYGAIGLLSISIPNDASVSNSSLQQCFSLAFVAYPPTISNFSLNICYSLRGASIPPSITSLNSSCFNSCYTLPFVSIPSVTTISSSCFSGCSNLKKFTIPSGVTVINGAAFSSCSSLASLTVPSSVTTIYASAFTNCYGISEYHFLATTPPTLSNTNAFTGISSDCKIYVPSSKLNDYKTAENWATYASYMVGE